MRACRAAPAFGVETAAEAAGVSLAAAQKALKGLPRRGRCLQLAEELLPALPAGRTYAYDALGETLLKSTGLSKRIAPPAVRLLAEDAPEKLLRRASGTDVWHSRRAVLWESALWPRAGFAAQAADGSIDDAAGVAGLATCPPVMLQRLAAETDWEVRTAVASNPDAPAGALVLLSRDQDADVAFAVVNNRREERPLSGCQLCL